MNRSVRVIIEKDQDGYYAYCPQLPGCHSQGESLEEIKGNIQEAIKLYLSTLTVEEQVSLLKQEVITMEMEVQVA
jgi:predicted RNase H-like HicB family nuclease